jgi:hypothetical protein
MAAVQASGGARVKLHEVESEPQNRFFRIGSVWTSTLNPEPLNIEPLNG